MGHALAAKKQRRVQRTGNKDVILSSAANCGAINEALYLRGIARLFFGQGDGS
jgi:hypothetical protein